MSDIAASYGITDRRFFDAIKRHAGEWAITSMVGNLPVGLPVLTDIQRKHLAWPRRVASQH